MSKEKFVPVNGAYNITSAQQKEFTEFLRNKIKYAKILYSYNEDEDIKLRTERLELS